MMSFMTPSSPRKPKKKTKDKAEEHSQDEQFTMAHNQVVAYHVNSGPPPPPPPKRKGSMYDQSHAIEKERYSDGEQHRAGDHRDNNRGLPMSMHGERIKYRDDSRSKSSGISKLAREVKHLLKDSSGYDDDVDYDNRPSPGYFPAYEERSSRPSKDSLMREIQRLRNENKALAKDNLELVKELSRANHSVDQSEATTHRMQQNLDNKENFLSKQALDHEVKSNFLILMTNIRTWTGKLEPVEPGTFDPSKLDDKTRDELDLVAPGCLSSNAEFWTDRSGKKMRMLFRGWLGQVVSHSILRVRTGDAGDDNDARDLWLPQRISNAATILEDELNSKGNMDRVFRKSFNNWRALSCDVLSKIKYAELRAEQEIEQGKFATRLMGILKPFLPLEETEILLKTSLIQTIFNEAIKFSSFIRRQRSAWLVVDSAKLSPPKVGSACVRGRYLPEFMEDAELDDEDCTDLAVKLFIAPALVKRGNSEGEDYENRDCMIQTALQIASILRILLLLLVRLRKKGRRCPALIAVGSSRDDSIQLGSVWSRTKLAMVARQLLTEIAGATTDDRVLTDNTMFL